MMFPWLCAVVAISGAEMLSQVLRPPQPDGLSGITRVDDARYLSIDDSYGRLVSVRFAMNRLDGTLSEVIVTNEVFLSGVIDGEGLAFDPLRKTIWVADEKGSRISEHDPKSGRRLSEVRMPPHFARARKDVEIESLAIAPDGLTMWTATEEAVEGDGNRSSRASGTVVRLQRFSRNSGGKPWRAAGQFAYLADPMDGGPVRKLARSGLSDLCVLPTGELIALEREFSAKGFLPTFRLRLYRVDLAGAEDVSGIDRLEGRRFRTAGKTLLLGMDSGFAMYEGLCVGPKLSDGSQTLVLVSDGDGEAIETLMSVRLVRDKSTGDLVK